MRVCREPVHVCTRAMHMCAETYQLCTDNAAANRLIPKANSDLKSELHRDTSLVHKSNARLHGKMRRVQRGMHTAHGDKSDVLEGFVGGVEGRVLSAQKLLSCALGQTRCVRRGCRREQEHAPPARTRSTGGDVHLATEGDVSLARMILDAHVCWIAQSGTSGATIKNENPNASSAAKAVPVTNTYLRRRRHAPQKGEN